MRKGEKKWSYVLGKHVAGVRLGSGVAASSGSGRESASIFFENKRSKIQSRVRGLARTCMGEAQLATLNAVILPGACKQN